MGIKPKRQPKIVERLDFRCAEPQAWRDSWRGGVLRVCRYVGPCVGCGKRCYGFDDGENDPRGVLGDNANWGLELNVAGTKDEDREGRVVEFPACPMCMNDEPRYRRAMSAAAALVRGAP